MPAPRTFPSGASWHAGKPDLIVESPEITVKANSPDWWGEFPPTKLPITEDRYVQSVEIREVNNFSKDAAGRDTVGQRYVWHHLIWATAPVDESGDPLDASVTDGAVGWPVHEVGRNADVFDDNAGRLLKAGSSIIYQSAHLHAGGLDVKSKLLFRLQVPPGRLQAGPSDVAAQPRKRPRYRHQAERGEPAAACLRECCRPAREGRDVRAAPARAGTAHVSRGDLGLQHPDAHLRRLRSQLGSPGPEYQDDYAPILPRGTILHIIGYMDNTPNNKNIPDPRNWQGSGNRSIANMFIDLGQIMPLSNIDFAAGDGETPRAPGAESSRRHRRMSAL